MPPSFLEVQETFLRVFTGTERAKLLNTLKKGLPINRAAPAARTPTEYNAP
jgi:hypothetical protein